MSEVLLVKIALLIGYSDKKTSFRKKKTLALKIDLRTLKITNFFVTLNQKVLQGITKSFEYIQLDVNITSLTTKLLNCHRVQKKVLNNYK